MNPENEAIKQRIYNLNFARVYPMYVAKVERKGRAKSEAGKIIGWLTGYTQKGLEAQIRKQVSFEEFFTKAPKLNPLRTLITGVICGVRVEEIKDPIMREVRYLDKLIDELAKGKAMILILEKEIGAPATRALINADIKTVKQLTKYTEKEIADLHGVGPKAIGILKRELISRGLTFKSN